MAKTTKKSEKTALTPTKRPKTKMPKTVKVTAEEAEAMSLADAQETIIKEEENSTKTIEKETDAKNDTVDNITIESEDEETILSEQEEPAKEDVKHSEEKPSGTEKEQGEALIENNAFDSEKVANQPPVPEMKKEQNILLVNLKADIDGSRKRQAEQNTMRKMMGYDHMGICYDD